MHAGHVLFLMYFAMYLWIKDLYLIFLVLFQCTYVLFFYLYLKLYCKDLHDRRLAADARR